MTIARRGLIGAAIAPTLLPRPLRAQPEFPNRAMRVIIPWPPGGGVDVFGRVFLPALAAKLGQPIVIDNLGGASGRIGTQAAARATADGYTLALVNDTFAATEALPVPGAPALRSAFSPVTLAISAPQGLFTHPRSGLPTARAFAEAARERPGGLNVGVPGIGSSQHLTSELLLRASGKLRVEHVPYRGGGPLLQDLIAGTIDAAVVTSAAAAEQVRSGQLVGLVVTSAERSASLPDVPTARETIAPGFVQTTWMGLLAPLGTPSAAIARIHEAAVAALSEPVVRQRLAILGFDVVGQDGPGFARLFDDTVSVFASIAAERNIRAET